MTEAAETALLRARVVMLEVALTALVRRLDEIANDPEFKTMQTLYYTHGFRYGGPSFAEPLEDARSLLVKPPQ